MNIYFIDSSTYPVVHGQKKEFGVSEISRHLMRLGVSFDWRGRQTAILIIQATVELCSWNNVFIEATLKV